MIHVGHQIEPELPQDTSPQPQTFNEIDSFECCVPQIKFGRLNVFAMIFPQKNKKKNLSVLNLSTHFVIAIQCIHY